MATPATNPKVKKELVFGDNGQVIDEAAVGDETEVIEETDEIDEVEASAEGDETEETEQTAEEIAAAATTNKDKTKLKYRIGDKFFATLEEAQAYATQSETAPNVELDAYRQGILDGKTGNAPAQNVTTPENGAIDEEYYSNPAEFLRKRDERLKNETVQTVQQTLQQQQYAEQVWNEFSNRHPDLADFREEVDGLALKNKDGLQAVVRSKGRNAGLDFLAVQVKAHFQRIADATKKRKALPNGGAGASPSGTRQSVTPKNTPKKILSMAEQIRSIKRVRQ